MGDSPNNGNGEQQPGKRRISKSRRTILKEVRAQNQDESTSDTPPQAQTPKLESKGKNPVTTEDTEQDKVAHRKPGFTRRVSDKIQSKAELFTVNETAPVERTNSAKFYGQQDARRQFHSDAQKSKEEAFKISDQQSKANKRLQNTQNQVDEVVGIMAKNVDLMQDRQMKLDEAAKRAENLANQSLMFTKTTKKIKEKFWWEDMKMKLMLGLCVFLFLLAIVGAALYFAL